MNEMDTSSPARDDSAEEELMALRAKEQSERVAPIRDYYYRQLGSGLVGGGSIYASSLSQEEVRLFSARYHAFERAFQLHGNNRPAQDIIATAKVFEAYLLGRESGEGVGG
jgi:hypothetical protein